MSGATGPSLPTSARAVIVGAGIVGASVAYHLAREGWSDLVIVDQGPLWETGGSTSHAPGLVFQTNTSRTMCRIAQDTVALYASLELDGEPGWYGVGGIEVATTPERMQELKRRQGFARSYGLEDTALITPAEAAERIPLLDPSTILGAYLVPSDGIAKAVRLAEALARRASERGVAFEGGVTVAGFDIRDGRVRGVETSQGRIECERVLICAGIWGPTVGAMAGVPIPLVAVQHQLVWTDPIPELEGETREVAHPILRHQDMAMYFRHRGDHYAVGNYQHEPIATAQSALRAPGGAMQPSLMPWTASDFDVAEAEAARMLPALKGRMRPSDPTRSLNGMFSFTPDAGSIVGESAKVRGVWVCEAVWVTHGGGMGQQVARWMATGEPSYDLAEADANRFYPYMTTPPFVLERGKQQYREVYDIIHPLQPMEEPRPLRTSPFYEREGELGAYFLEGGGWERPHWYGVNETLLGRYEVPGRNAWAARYWHPIVGAEARATRDGVAMFDVTPLKRLAVEGPGAAAFLDRLTTNRVDRPVGTVVYSLMLDESGGVRSDLTIARLATDRFQVGANGPLDLDELARRAAEGAPGEVAVRDITSGTCCIGLWGPRARDVLSAVTDADLSNEAFGYFKAREIWVGTVPVTALRLSYVGELGWELYTSADMGLHLWDTLWAAGREHGVIAAGRGAFGSLRLEKGYRFAGVDMTTEHDPYEAGLGFAVRVDKGEFVGRAALEGKSADAVTRRLVPLLIDDPSAVVMGKEPVHVDGRPAGYVTSAGFGYTIGSAIAYAWLPVVAARPGQRVAIRYFGEEVPATVAEEPLFDRDMTRLRS